MKILLINKFHYIKGGSETYYFGLGKLLKEKGHEVIYFSMKDELNFPCSQERYFVEHVDFNDKMSKMQKIQTGLKILYSREAKKKISELIEKEKPDVVHLNLFQRQLTHSIIDAIRKYNIPIVYTAHDLNCVCPNYMMLTHGNICEECKSGHYGACFRNQCVKNSSVKSFLSAAEAYLYKWKKTYQKIDLIITPSAFYKRKIEEASVTSTSVVHIKNFLPPGSVYHAELRNDSYFLYFGRLSIEKGIMTLLKAYQISNLQNPLYLAGSGSMEKEIKEYIRINHLEERVRLLGFQSGDVLHRIIQRAKCIILPSEWYENGPYTIMEAMAQGKPVIVSSNGGLPEIVENGATGYIANPGDINSLSECMQRMAKLSSDEYRGMSEKAVANAKRDFDADQYLKKLLKYYEQVRSSYGKNRSSNIT
ncbi:glycosyltransferase [uncultured Robinsoniella sp.]|uniref:glycosyltransferase n=1 Tax=uncultured Robinsoniella sp. TaxID=904190 RepID=UPI00374FD05C